MGGPDEIGFIRREDVGNVGLWIAIDKREPSALHLNHDAVATLKGVQYILDLELDRS